MTTRRTHSPNRRALLKAASLTPVAASASWWFGVTTDAPV